MANFKELINSDTPVLVDFYAEWCQPCQMMPPILDELKQKVGDQVKILKVDVDKNQQAAVNYGVKGVPTLILFRNGEIKWQSAGIIPADQLEKVVQEHGVK